MSRRGQAMILMIVLLPLLLVTLGVIIRSGKMLLIHNQVQNHCNRIVLDALAAEAGALQTLGSINPWAKRVIEARRHVDELLESGLVLVPGIGEELAATREGLWAAQKLIGASQSAVILQGLLQARAVMTVFSNSFHGGKLIQSFGPTNVLLPHASKNSLRLHIQDEEEYLGEPGAPKELDGDFAARQYAEGKITILSESFLKREEWPGFEKMPPVFITCKAHVKMNDLEGKWEVRLDPLEARRSLKRLLPFP